LRSGIIIEDRINPISTDTPLAFEDNFEFLSKYGDSLRGAAFEAKKAGAKKKVKNGVGVPPAIRSKAACRDAQCLEHLQRYGGRDAHPTEISSGHAAML